MLVAERSINMQGKITGTRRKIMESARIVMHSCMLSVQKGRGLLICTHCYSAVTMQKHGSRNTEASISMHSQGAHGPNFPARQVS